ncbi:anthrone oxygenase family protein [Microlunatus soli]|uniref:Uncharacterized membrane protein n=1 Tax=Microlunatus soli TaxID=630515 RepID=A0A1H1ZWW1_9ACTN|nr:DUF1772 domain-containing protein [Microlunatus soli]SDT37882.1 Uncharacterized membrane protein [Microlunatus soli]
MTSRHSGTNGSIGTAILIIATLTTGLTAGVFTDWSNTIMPGLADVDDRTFVLAFRSLDASINNPFFLGVEFSGALLFTVAAGALQVRTGRRTALPWILAALVAYLTAIMITFAVNEPLNTRLRTIDEPAASADFAALRAELNAARWAAWNTARAVTATIAFGCLLVALSVRRRSRADRSDASARSARLDALT